MTVSLQVRDAQPADGPFLVACAEAMAWETEARQLNRERLQRGVQGVFEQPSRGCYLLAERDGESLGTLMYTYEWSDWRAGDFFWIQSVFVRPEARRSGVYRALYEAVLERVRLAGAVGVRLYVEQDNLRAQQTYAALGMSPSAYRMYQQGGT